MSKSNPSKEDKRSRVRASKPRALVSISLVLSLVVTAVALANWGGSRAATQKSKEKKSGEMTIANFSAGSPSKEYIYAGGWLVATEECGYSISPTSSFFQSVGSDGSVNVTAPTGCNWTVGSLPTWMTLNSAGSGSGSAVVSFSVRDNFTGSARQATFTIAGLNFTVVQDGGFANCVYEILPTSATYSASGGSGSITVTVDSHCGWQAVSNASWLTVTSGNVGIGNSTVGYSVGLNTTGLGRNATITIGSVGNSRTFNVKQKAT